ncbi:MAG TPA: MBL fold metallo-hydrolase [Thermoanaerobaculia bacterium]|nr:MBL fold metallo-hydrolase [Thermoanaerobaculia bacterium]
MTGGGGASSRKAAGVAALVGPVFLAILVIVLSQRPSGAAFAIAGAILAVVVVSDVVLIMARRGVLAAAALAMDAAVIVLLATYHAAPLQRPAPFSGALPPASPPPEMAAYRIPTGVNHHSAAFGYRGGSFFERRDFTMTAVLVRHPGGDLLIDSGLSRSIAEQLRLMSLSFRLLTNYELRASAAEQLDAAGYDRSRLRILLTHAHWDHASGLRDFPNVPILVTAGELRFIEDAGPYTQIARSTPNPRYEVYGFEGGPYLGFPASHDFYGDGSIVAVPTPGHTPGSVIIFVTLPPERRYAFVGDLVWQLEGIRELEERPWIARGSDLNPGEVRENLLRMAAVAERFPSMRIVPAHDSRGFEGLPRFGSGVLPR